MKNPRHLNTDYDAWLRKITSRTVEEILQNISSRYLLVNAMMT